MGDLEYGVCGICGKQNVRVHRKYYNYPDVKCECHSPNHFDLVLHCNDCEPKQPTYTRIQVRTDFLLENGVIVPPCKVGDKVYWIDGGKIKCGEVFEISIHIDGILVHTGTQFCLEPDSIFLTREEAEKAIQGVKG